ncbi:MAG: NAD-dependent malic enzyme [Acidimicrobiia bacterium]
MQYQPITDPATGERYLPVERRGRTLVEEPLLNKGTAFTAEERLALALEGLLPHHVSTLDEQVAQALEQLADKESDLQKHIYLAGLQDRNETLFYRVLTENLTDTVPLVYTPTVADACKNWSKNFRRPRGVYVTPDDRGRIADLLRNADIEAAIVVVTDNERILGIGDQGAGGMGIPIGKLALYTAGAGIHPSVCLPMSLDVGTDNQELLDDPLYLGYRAPRLRGDDYWTLIDETVYALKAVFPEAILQWEDFSNRTSFRLLDTYVDVIPSFNDDIQGTATMVVGGLQAAMRHTRRSLGEQRVAIAGAGSAGVGIARLLTAAMVRDGVDEKTARRRIVLCDSRGLVVEGRDGVEGERAEFAADRATVASWGVTSDIVGLESVVTHHQPSILIGATGTPGTFTRVMVASMAATHDRPIVMPLSNPTRSAEAKPSDIIAWSDGRALVATGSPFPDVDHGGVRHRIGQANNVFIFPGLGLGAMVARASAITPGMFLAAGDALADTVTPEDLDGGSLYPSITGLRGVSEKVAIAVATAAVGDGVARSRPTDLPAAVRAAMWTPEYVPYRTAATEPTVSAPPAAEPPAPWYRRWFRASGA